MIRSSEDEPNAFAEYWKAYGGWRALWSSGYARLAVATTILTAPLWLDAGWWDTSLAVLPNLLGFTLGAYALLVSFGDERFKSFLITTKSDRSSAFIEVSSSFAHFILVQASALIVALVAKSFDSTELDVVSHLSPLWWLRIAWWGFGFFLFVYSAWLVIATALGLFQITQWFNAHQLSESAATTEGGKDKANSIPPEVPPQSG